MQKFNRAALVDNRHRDLRSCPQMHFGTCSIDSDALDLDMSVAGAKPQPVLAQP